MPEPGKLPASAEEAENAAAAWMLRLSEGLGPEEEAAFAEWLAASPVHADLMEEYRIGWDRFEPLAAQAAAQRAAPDPDRFAADPRLRGKSVSLSDAPEGGAARRRRSLVPYGLAAAAAIAVGIFLWQPRVAVSPALSPSVAAAPPCEQRVLDDGSVIQLNRGAAVSVAYSATERRITLEKGEANFTVARNAERPFIVSAGGIEVRAVGTAFNVRYGAAAVDVVVTEGRVRVGTIAEMARDAAALAMGRASGLLPLVAAGQRATVALASPSPTVVSVDRAEIEALLAWQPQLLDFDDVPLSSVAAEFNRHNPVHLVISDPVLASLRVSASFRSDNVDGFLRLVESNYGIHAIRGTGSVIVLEERP